MNDLYFRVADAGFRILFTDVDDGRPLLPSFAPFHIKERAEELIFTMTVGEDQQDVQPEGESVGTFDCGGCNHTIHKTADGGYIFSISNEHDVLSCTMRSSADFKQCRCRLHGDGAARRFGLNNAVMIAFAFAGARHGILLMHASVPMKDGKAYLFLGKSGTGKSTHCGLWLDTIPGTELLNDDNPAVRLTEQGTYIYGSPWSGKTPCYRNLKMQAGAFLRLEQAPENLIRREKGVHAFASILSSCSTMIWDKPSYNAICDTVARITAQVPAYHLRCLPDRAAAELSYHTIAQE